MYGPFGSVWPWLTGLSIKLGPHVLAFRFSLVLMYWSFGSVLALPGPDVLALRARLIMMYWPLGPVWSWLTGPSGQVGHDVLALCASLVLTYWPFGPSWSWCTGPSGQLDPDLLRASLVLTKSDLKFGFPVLHLP